MSWADLNHLAIGFVWGTALAGATLVLYGWIEFLRGLTS